MQAQREPQPPSFPCRLEKPVRPESLSAPAMRRHNRPSAASGQIQNILHLVAVDAAHQCQQLVGSGAPGAGWSPTRSRSDCRASRYSWPFRMSRTVMVRPREKMRPVYRPAARVRFISTSACHEPSPQSPKHARDRSPAGPAGRRGPVDGSPGRLAIAQKFFSRNSDHPCRIVNKDLRRRPVIEQRVWRIQPERPSPASAIVFAWHDGEESGNVPAYGA
jgi:hypothetical protein